MFFRIRSPPEDRSIPAAGPKKYVDLIHYDGENYIKICPGAQWLLPRNYGKLPSGGKILNHCRAHN
jgi:hypothetical protein